MSSASHHHQYHQQPPAFPSTATNGNLTNATHSELSSTVRKRKSRPVQSSRSQTGVVMSIQSHGDISIIKRMDMQVGSDKNFVAGMANGNSKHGDSRKRLSSPSHDSEHSTDTFTGDQTHAISSNGTGRPRRAAASRASSSTVANRGSIETSSVSPRIPSMSPSTATSPISLEQSAHDNSPRLIDRHQDNGSTTAKCQSCRTMSEKCGQVSINPHYQVNPFYASLATYAMNYQSSSFLIQPPHISSHVTNPHHTQTPARPQNIYTT